LTFSVLTAVHKDEVAAHFDAALESIWSVQSVKPAQLVIVKDGPLTFELEQIIQQWQGKLDKALKLIEFPCNLGLGAALKVGLEACNHNLVARMDTDDLAAPDRFERQLSYLADHPEVDILGSFVQEMSYSGDILGVRNAPIGHDEIVSCLWASPMVHPSIMMRRSRVLEAGNYDASYRRRQDYELWFRCAEKGLRFYNLPEPLLYYRFGKHTHKKQPPRLAWEQAMIGYRGAKRLRMPSYQRLACFLPFIRSLLPSTLQHVLYKILSRFDPRRKA
jgi:glycosyltransferase involved in cell wall biosynthesis